MNQAIADRDKLTMRTKLQTDARGGTTVEWMAALAVLLFLVILIILARHRHRPGETVVNSEFPVRFVGVRPEGSDDILDASGRLVRQELYGLPAPKAWGTNKLRRNFIFEIASTNVGPVTSLFRYHLSSPSLTMLGVQGSQVYRLPNGDTRIEVRTELPIEYRRSFLRFFRRTEKVTRLDAHLTFYTPQATTHAAVFTQLSPGTTNTVFHDGDQFSASIQESTNAWNSELILKITPTTPQRWSTFKDVVFLKNNRGELVASQGQSMRSQGTSRIVTFTFPDVAPLEIREILLLKGQSIHVSNIRVRYPNRPNSKSPPWLSQVSEILKPGANDPPELYDIFNVNADRSKALAVMPLARSSQIPILRGILFRMASGSEQGETLDAWPAEERDIYRTNAWRWARSAYPSVRKAGIILGLQGEWPEFVEPAMDFLTSPEPSDRDQAAGLLKRSAHLLNASQLQRIADLVRQCNDEAFNGKLTQCLAANPSDTARQILLDLSTDMKPWVWWPTLRSQSPEAWRQDDRLSSQAKARLILTYGPRTDDPEARIDEAWLEFFQIMTPDLRRNHLRIFMFLAKQLQTLPSRHETAAIAWAVDHLRAYPWPERDPFATWILVQHLDRWRGTSFTQPYSSQAIEKSPDWSTIPWQGLVDEVLRQEPTP